MAHRAILERDLNKLAHPKRTKNPPHSVAGHGDALLISFPKLPPITAELIIYIVQAAPDETENAPDHGTEQIIGTFTGKLVTGQLTDVKGHATPASFDKDLKLMTVDVVAPGPTGAKGGGPTVSLTIFPNNLFPDERQPAPPSPQRPRPPRETVATTQAPARNPQAPAPRPGLFNTRLSDGRDSLASLARHRHRENAPSLCEVESLHFAKEPSDSVRGQSEREPRVRRRPFERRLPRRRRSLRRYRRHRSCHLRRTLHALLRPCGSPERHRRQLRRNRLVTPRSASRGAMVDQTERSRRVGARLAHSESLGLRMIPRGCVPCTFDSCAFPPDPQGRLLGPRPRALPTQHPLPRRSPQVLPTGLPLLHLIERILRNYRTLGTGGDGVEASAMCVRCAAFTAVIDGALPSGPRS